MWCRLRRSQVRTLRASNTTLKRSELELRLENGGLRDELGRWRDQFGATPPQAAAEEAEASLDMAAEAAAMPPATGSSDSPSPAASSGAQAQVLRVFQTMSEAEQQECLRALQKHAADALPGAGPGDAEHLKVDGPGEVPPRKSGALAVFKVPARAGSKRAH